MNRWCRSKHSIRKRSFGKTKNKSRTVKIVRLFAYQAVAFPGRRLRQKDHGLMVNLLNTWVS